LICYHPYTSPILYASPKCAIQASKEPVFILPRQQSSRCSSSTGAPALLLFRFARRSSPNAMNSLGFARLFRFTKVGSSGTAVTKRWLLADCIGILHHTTSKHCTSTHQLHCLHCLLARHCLPLPRQLSPGGIFPVCTPALCHSPLLFLQFLYMCGIRVLSGG